MDKHGGYHYYDKQTTFVFKDRTAVADASLEMMKVTHKVIDEENPDKDETKEYTLSPEFNSEILEYETEIREYIDDIDLTIKKTDPEGTSKVRVPKRDENRRVSI